MIHRHGFHTGVIVFVTVLCTAPISGQTQTVELTCTLAGGRSARTRPGPATQVRLADEFDHRRPRHEPRAGGAARP